MTKYLPEAFVAIEDERFYKHKGVDLKRTLAATTTYVFKGEFIIWWKYNYSTVIKNITNDKDNSGQLELKENKRNV